MLPASMMSVTPSGDINVDLTVLGVITLCYCSWIYGKTRSTIIPVSYTHLVHLQLYVAVTDRIQTGDAGHGLPPDRRSSIATHPPLPHGSRLDLA